MSRAKWMLVLGLAGIPVILVIPAPDSFKIIFGLSYVGGMLINSLEMAIREPRRRAMDELVKERMELHRQQRESERKLQAAEKHMQRSKARVRQD